MSYILFIALITTQIEKTTVQTSKADYEAFQAGVAASFERLIPAVFNYVVGTSVPKNQRKRETELMNERYAAIEEFRKQVAANWPYKDPELEMQRQEYAHAMKEIHVLFSQAKSDQIQGADRDKVISRILEYAKPYPNSLVSDLAYSDAAYLYWDLKPRKDEEGYKLMKAICDSATPLSFWKIGAMTNLKSVAYSDEPQLAARLELSAAIEQRLSACLKFSSTMRKLHDIDELKKQLLNPLPMESINSYVGRVTSTLTIIQGQYDLNSRSMIFDAMRTANPQESIDKLRKEEADNIYLQEEIKKRGLDKQ
jgi:hypothetical protein